MLPFSLLLRCICSYQARSSCPQSSTEDKPRTGAGPYQLSTQHSPQPGWDLLGNAIFWSMPGELYPLVNIQKAMENGHRNSGFSHEKRWIFHGKMLVHQRVLQVLTSSENVTWLHSSVDCSGSNFNSSLQNSIKWMQGKSSGGQSTCKPSGYDIHTSPWLFHGP